MTALTDNAWIARVGEIRQLASELMSTNSSAGYAGHETSYVEDLLTIAELTDLDEIRVLQAEIERITGYTEDSDVRVDACG
jgi:hypothetical protein